ncbi:MAG: hypothetical protein HY686_06775 [Chloroflexi bacterium]|nr:hypothetical protein [Chloroflexota bacterium]
MTPEFLTALPTMTTPQLLAACPPQWPPDYVGADIRYGGVFRQAMAGDPPFLDPLRTSSSFAQGMASMAYERLVMYDTGPTADPVYPAIVPDLATSWEWNGDATQLTFHLRQGVHWGDLNDPLLPGPEMTAVDLVYALNEYKSNPASVKKGYFTTMTIMEVIDNYTLRLTFSQPSLDMLPFLASNLALMFNPYLAQSGPDAMKLRAIGPGPFELYSPYEYNVGATFTRNPNFFQVDEAGNSLPYLDGAKFIVIPDQAVRDAALRVGLLEYAQSLSATLSDQIARLTARPDLAVYAAPSLGGSSFYLAMNQYTADPPSPLQDLRVRRALSLATDTKAISDAVFGPTGYPQDTMIPWRYFRNTPPTWAEVDAYYGLYQHHYNPQLADQLLAEAGYPNGFQTKITFFAYNPQTALPLDMVAAQWAQVGVQVLLEQTDYTVYRAMIDNGSYEYIINGFNLPSWQGPGDIYCRLHLNQGCATKMNLNDPVLNTLTEQVRSATPTTDVTALLQQIKDRYNDQVYWIDMPTYGAQLAGFWQPWVKGLREHRFSGGFAYWGQPLRHVWLDFEPQARPTFRAGVDQDGAGGLAFAIQLLQPQTGLPQSDWKIKSYSASLDYPGSPVSTLEVRLKPPFETGTVVIDNPTGTAQFSASAAQGVTPPLDPVAFATLRLGGCTTDAVTITPAITEVLDGNGSPLPVEQPALKTFRRGDAKANGIVDMADALFIAQYIAGLRGLGEDVTRVNAVNASSVKQDGAFDKITAADVLLIAQRAVGQRDDCFNLLPAAPPPLR